MQRRKLTKRPGVKHAHFVALCRSTILKITEAVKSAPEGVFPTDAANAAAAFTRTLKQGAEMHLLTAVELLEFADGLNECATELLRRRPLAIAAEADLLTRNLLD